MNLAKNIKKYVVGDANSEGRKPGARYASFDYCFNYFQSFREAGKRSALVNAENVHLSCLQLGFYLASWGMFRGSTNLLQKSARHLIPAVEVISDADELVWDIDAHCYSEENIQQLLDLAQKLRQALPGMTDVLVTKIMLGVFGNVPAFDTNFKRGFRASTFGPKALRRIGALYRKHAKVIDEHRIHTLDFVTGKPTRRRYTRAKVIDMAFFVEGMS